MTRRRWDAARAVPELARLQGERLETLRRQIAWQLSEHPENDLRLALAEHYRSRGVGSHAARWGIVIPG